MISNLFRTSYKGNISLIQINLFSTRKDVAKYFVTLGVPINSDQETVRLAFIELVKKYHPDSKSAVANAHKFQEIENAYRKLQEKFSSDRFNLNDGLSEYGLYYEEKREEEEEEEHPDIKHTAPQHRQYLSYEGLGSGTPSQRLKQYNSYKTAKAVENVTQYRINQLTEENPDAKHMINKESKKKIKDIRTGFGMDRLVEDLIQESITRGEFDNLAGSGKPLKPTTSENNPYVDFVTHKMNQVLIENGFTPMWITLQKEIREDTEGLRKRLWELRKTMGSLPLTDKENIYWKKIIIIFSDDVKLINGKIDTYNLLVPLLHQQVFHLDVEKEARQALEKGPCKQVMDIRSEEKNKNEHSRKENSFRRIISSFFESK